MSGPNDNDTASAPRFLILRGGAIGDFVLTLPAIQAIRAQWPDAYIEIVGYPHIASLAEASRLIDRVTSLDKAEMARFFSLHPDISREQKTYVQSFNVIISYLYDPSGAVEENMKASGARRFIYASPKVTDGHAIDHLLRPLTSLAIFGDGSERPWLTLEGSRVGRGYECMRHYGERVAAVHPGSGSPRKNWPFERFAELSRRLPDETGITPVFILGEADHALREHAQGLAPAVPVLPPCSLVDLAGALSACTAFIGNDSGVTHVAAALGLPVVALFGPTDPAVWGPRGANVRILSGAEATTEALSGIPVDQVLAALRDVLS